MTGVVYQYRVYCIEENTHVTVWGTEEPTLCPNDHSDRTINSSKTVIVDSVDQNTTQVTDGTKGLFRFITMDYDIPAGNTGDVSTFDRSFPMDVNIWKTELYSHSTNVGDRLNIILAPNTTVGYLTAPGSTGATGLSVSETVVDNKFVSKGTYTRLFNNPTGEDLGRITDYTLAGSTGGSILVENGLSDRFPPGTLVQISLIMVDGLLFCKDNGSHLIGDKGFKSKEIPAGTILRVEYTNNSTEAKKFVVYLEVYFS